MSILGPTDETDLGCSRLDKYWSEKLTNRRKNSCWTYQYFEYYETLGVKY